MQCFALHPSPFRADVMGQSRVGLLTQRNASWSVKPCAHPPYCCTTVDVGYSDALLLSVHSFHSARPLLLAALQHPWTAGITSRLLQAYNRATSEHSKRLLSIHQFNAKFR